MEPAGVESKYAVQLYAEEVASLYKNAPLAYTATLVNGALLAFVQSAHVGIPAVLAWYAVLATVISLRAGFLWRYVRARPAPEAAPRWNRLYVVGTALAGSVWGAAAIIMIPSGSAAHEVFVAFVLAGMSAGSITVLAFRLEACVAFLLPTLVPLLVRYLLLATTLNTVMAIMTSIFLVGMVLSASSFHRSVRTALLLRFDKRELEAENQRRERAERALSLERDRLKTVLSSIGEGVALVDAHGRVEYLNGVAEGICGHSSASAQGRPACEVFKCFDRDRGLRTSSAMEDSLRSGRQVSKLTVMTREGGAPRTFEELATPLFDGSRRLAGAVSILRDVTDWLRWTDELAYAADHDALTGLPNRSLLLNRLEQAIARAQRRHEHFALLFLDLNGFKDVNDTMGHAAGDALLVQVARRLTHTVREEDTIARLGGDEFVVLLEGPTQAQHVKAVADKISQTLREPYRLNAHSASISVSIGASLFPDDGRDPEALLENADADMYRAKRSMGPHRFRRVVPPRSAVGLPWRSAQRLCRRRRSS